MTSTTNAKIAVVTGANKGLGYALVKGLCTEFDGTVYLTSRDEDRGKNACKDLQQLGLKPAYFQLDITDENSVTRFFSYIETQHGFIDVLINNAGILFLKDSAEPKVLQAEQTLTVNFFALVKFCEKILLLMRNGGKIINISSSSGHLSRIPSQDLRNRMKSTDLTLEGLKDLMNKYVEDVKNNKEIEEGWGDSPYVVSKVGVNAYTFMLHRRLASKEILVNCVHPGYVISDMTRGAGNITPEAAGKIVLNIALQSQEGGQYLWHDGSAVPWDGPDPRGYIDGKV